MTILSASLALQRGVHARLTGHAPLMALVKGVFDHAPDGADPPYISIGEDIVADWSTKTFLAREHRLTIHAWAAGPGRGPVKELLALTEAALESPPVPDGHALIDFRFLSSRTIREPESLLHHGVIEFRARTCPL